MVSKPVFDNCVALPPFRDQTNYLQGANANGATIEEALRIKTFLVLERNATRDYLDIAVLAEKLGHDRTHAALDKMDLLYPQNSPDQWIVRTQIVKQLAQPKPYDLDVVDLAEYKSVRPLFHEIIDRARMSIESDRHRGRRP